MKNLMILSTVNNFKTFCETVLSSFRTLCFRVNIIISVLKPTDVFMVILARYLQNHSRKDALEAY